MGKIFKIIGLVYTPPTGPIPDDPDIPTPDIPTEPEEDYDFNGWKDGYYAYNNGEFISTDAGWLTTGIIITLDSKEYKLIVPNTTGSTRIVYFNANGSYASYGEILFNTVFIPEYPKFAINIGVIGCVPLNTFTTLTSKQWVRTNVVLDISIPLVENPEDILGWKLGYYTYGTGEYNVGTNWYTSGIITAVSGKEYILNASNQTGRVRLIKFSSTNSYIDGTYIDLNQPFTVDSDRFAVNIPTTNSNPRTSEIEFPSKDWIDENLTLNIYGEEGNLVNPSTEFWKDGFMLAGGDGSYTNEGTGWVTSGMLTTDTSTQYTLVVPGKTGSTRILYYNESGVKTNISSIEFNTPTVISSAKFAINLGVEGCTPANTFTSLESKEWIRANVVLLKGNEEVQQPDNLPYTVGYYNAANGNFEEDSDWLTTGILTKQQFKTYTVNALGYTGTLRIVNFNSSGQFVSAGFINVNEGFIPSTDKFAINFAVRANAITNNLGVIVFTSADWVQSNVTITTGVSASETGGDLQVSTWREGFYGSIDGSYSQAVGWLNSGIITTLSGVTYTLNVPEKTGLTRIVYFNADNSFARSDYITFNQATTVSYPKFAINLCCEEAPFKVNGLTLLPSVAWATANVTLDTNTGLTIVNPPPASRPFN